VSRLVVVGSGTVVPEAGRGGSSYYVEAGGRRILLDCGPGAVQSLARLGLPWDRISDLVLTHFHADHVGALPGLFFAFRHGILPPREELLVVRGPPGTEALFGRLADALGPFLTDPGFPVEFREIAPGEEVDLGRGLRLAAGATPHTEESQGYRLEGGGVCFVYTGDTGPGAEVAAFAEGAGVLLTECSLHDEEVGDNHLSPGRVAELARAARPELLLLAHIYPHVRKAEPDALVAAAGWAGPLRLVEDGDEIPLPPA